MFRSMARPTVLSAFVLAASATALYAQALVINGMYDCQRATNGRAYCKRQGAPPDNQYQPVTDEFFMNYEAARMGRPAAAAPTVQQNQTNTQVNQTQVNNTVVIQLRTEASDLKG